MTANWGDREIRELLALRADEAIRRNFTGTVKDGPILEHLAQKLKKRGFSRCKTQVTSKLKTLRKKYYQINDRNGWSGEGRLDWQYFDMCQKIWGSSRPDNRSAVVDDVNERAPVEPCSPEPCSPAPCGSRADPAANSTGLDAAGSPNGDSQSCDELTYMPPIKRRKQTRAQLITDEIRQLIEEMDRDEEKRATLRDGEQRAFEARLTKEAQAAERAAREAERRERAEQTQLLGGLLKDILRELRVQSSLLRNLVAGVPLPASQTVDSQLTEDDVADRKPI